MYFHKVTIHLQIGLEIVLFFKLVQVKSMDVPNLFSMGRIWHQVNFLSKVQLVWIPFSFS